MRNEPSETEGDATISAPVRDLTFFLDFGLQTLSNELDGEGGDGGSQWRIQMNIIEPDRFDMRSRFYRRQNLK